MKSSERGVILVLVALTIFVLVALSAFAIDMGVLWMGRGEAQNAADGGAIAGATALQLNDASNLTTTGPAYTQAAAIASNNAVLGGAAGVHVDLAADTSTWEHAAPSTCSSGGCVQVDVYQDSTHGSSWLPAYFARVFGVQHQAIKATATAQVLSTNTSGCLSPFYIVDTTPPYSPTGTTNGLGTRVMFNAGIAPSNYGTMDAGSGAAALPGAIDHCTGKYSINQDLDTDQEPGGSTGPKRTAIRNLFDWDPDTGGTNAGNPVHLVYNPPGCDGVTTLCNSVSVVGGCAQNGTCDCSSDGAGLPCPYGGAFSPRIIQAAVCDPAVLNCTGTGKGTIQISNILSFFITGCDGTPGTCPNGGGGSPEIDAVLVTSAGQLGTAGGTGSGNSFLTVVELIR